MSGTMRTFIAIELPESVKQRIAEVQEGLKRLDLPVRWIPPENIHLTLRFLGDVDEQTLEAVKDAMGEAAASCGPLELAARGTGVFPNMRNPRILWIGVSGAVNELRELHECLEAALARAGLPREERRFTAHLTMGRTRRRISGRRLAEALEEHLGFCTETFTADSIRLIKSDLTPDGAVYTPLHDSGLGPESDGAPHGGKHG